MAKAPALHFAQTATPSKTTKGKDKAAPHTQAAKDVRMSPQATRPDREGKKLVATHLPQAAYTDLRILAAKLDTTQAALIEEALTDLMHKYKDQL